MPLNLPKGHSRFARTANVSLPEDALTAFREMINIIAGQGDAYAVYEHFKRFFAAAAGTEYIGSSDEGWASSDLSRDMRAAAANAPVFLSAIYDAVEALRANGHYDLPTIDDLNSVCYECRVGFAIDPPDVITTTGAALKAVAKINAAIEEVMNVYAETAGPEEEDEPGADLPDAFDVAITVAGPERKFARQLARLLTDGGVVVFYDEMYSDHLWGANLSDMFDDIFRRRSRFCVMFVSEAYGEREWTNHERRSAVARALKERGNAYILPIRVDDTDLPGLPPTIGYLSLEEVGIEEIAQRLIRKVRNARRRDA
jgi:SAM-dependent methyltransferase